MKTKTKLILFITSAVLIIIAALCCRRHGDINTSASATVKSITNANIQLPTITFWRNLMHENNKNSDSNSYPFWKRKRLTSDPEILKIEEKLRQAYLIFRPDVRKLLKLAYYGSKYVKQSALIRLDVILNSYGIQRIRAPDSFMPYGPNQLLSQGNILVFIQANGENWYIPADSLLTNGVILGPQQAGKSRFIIHLCMEIHRANPDTVITIIDPKGGFTDYAPLLNADYLDLSKISFDLKPPTGIKYEDFVLEFMPIVCDGAGLIYSIEIVNDAAAISLKHKDQYTQTTGQDTELSLKDIYCDLSLVSNTSFGRRSEYKQAAQTALHRIIGNRNLFACRKGINLERLFSKNTIINGRCLTDDLECRTLLSYFLFYKYQLSRYLPETNKLQHIIIVDDASRFLGIADYTGTSKRVSPLGNILAMLRSSGTSLVGATQLPGNLESSVIALSRFMAVIGPMSGKENLDVVRNFMSLNDEQIAAVTRLSTREAIGFAPNTAFKGIIHGWVPYVETPPVGNINEITSADLEIQPWHHLLEIPSKKADFAKKLDGVETEDGKKPILNSALNKASFNNHQTHRLIFDSVCYPFHSATARIKRLRLSGRDFENAKLEACEKGYLISSYAGSTLYLIPTQKAFDMFEMECPFKRTTSLEHAFYVCLGKFLLENDVRIKSVKAEVPIGNTGSAADIVTFANNGQMESWEVCLGTNYILANITKYKNTAFSKITLLSKDWELSQAIQKLIKFSGLETELLEKLEYTHFSKLLSLQRKLSRYS
jgi:hypothetical protein